MLTLCIEWCACHVSNCGVRAAGSPQRTLLQRHTPVDPVYRHKEPPVPPDIPRPPPDTPGKVSPSEPFPDLYTRDKPHSNTLDVWEARDVRVPRQAPVAEAWTGTPVFFQVRHDYEVPEHPEPLDAAILAVSGSPAIAIDIPNGFLSMRRSIFEQTHAYEPEAGGRDDADGTSSQESPGPVLFTGVEWGIGEVRISTAISALKLLKVLNKELLLCSSATGLAEAVDLAVSLEASNKTGRRALLQGVRRPAKPRYSNLDCGTHNSKKLCIIGDPPPDWSAGDRAVLVAGHFTKQFSNLGTMLVCAPIGPFVSRVLQGSSLPAAPSPGPAGTTYMQSSYTPPNVTVLAALGGCFAGVLVLFVAAVIYVYMRSKEAQKGTAAP